MCSDLLISAVSCYLNLNARNRLQDHVAYMPNISISDLLPVEPLKPSGSAAVLLAIEFLSPCSHLSAQFCFFVPIGSIVTQPHGLLHY